MLKTIRKSYLIRCNNYRHLNRIQNRLAKETEQRFWDIVEQTDYIQFYPCTIRVTYLSDRTISIRRAY